MIFQKEIIRLLKKAYYRYCALLIRIQEKTFKNGVKYIFRDNHSDNLLVIFSGIGGDYNYRRSLKYSTWDQLYIKNSWANGLSYYLYENGSNHPELLTSELINSLTGGGKYKIISSLGSSKGGSAALYFGLKHDFNEIYAGSCQYLVGNYIGVYHKDNNYYCNLMGHIPPKKGIAILNSKFENMLESKKNCRTIVNLIYSTKEHTFNDDTEPLLKKLNECHIQHKDQVESFTQHSMIGGHMVIFCKKHFK